MVPYASHVHHMCIPTNIDRLPVSYSNNSPAGYICFLPYFPLVTQLPIACHVAFAGGESLGTRLSASHYSFKRDMHCRPVY